MRKKQPRKPVKANSSDEESDPDPNSSEFYYDEVDEFHANRNKISLDKAVLADDSTSEDEDMVLGIESDSAEEDEIYNKYKQQLQAIKQTTRRDKGKKKKNLNEDELKQNWGKKKTNFYGGLKDDELDAIGSEDELNAAILEEKEARALQKKMAQDLDEEDFGLEMFAVPKKTKSGEEKIVKDLTKLPKKQKLEILKKESPELIELLNELESKIEIVQHILQPLWNLLHEEGDAVPKQTTAYVNTKLRLTLSYCINIIFYLKLKSERVPVHNHPIVKRLLQFRNLLKQLEPIDEQFQEEMELLVSCLEAGESVKFETITEEEPIQVERIPPIDSENIDELAAMEESGEEDEESQDAKRAITYQMKKNKGLTRYSKKEKSNPRVKHRMKFKKAKTRRKGQVRTPRTEMQRYGGELSGIRAGVRHSIKLQ